MGVKRPLEAEGFSGISFKQPKPIDYNEKLILITTDFPSQAINPKLDAPGTDNSHLDENYDQADVNSASRADNEMEASEQLSNVTSSSNEEEAENRDASFFHNFPPYVDVSIPWKPPTQFEDPYAQLLNSSPLKDIPIGPDYQAEVPSWDPNSSGRKLSGFHYKISNPNNSVENEEELRLMGTCIIPMPSLDDSSINGFKVGCGRTDWGCFDMGSIRCAQQHVKETREKLKDTFGEEIFKKLGFYEMGEVVASRWTPEDEHTFHRVIYSNPASHGRDFWKELSFVFPTRSKKEIVSYYFNVFMLRKRAVQNRSYMMRIDSDDDNDPDGADGDYHQNDSFLDQESDDEGDIRNSHDNFYLVGEEYSDEEEHHLLRLI